MRSYVFATILLLAGSACTESLTGPDPTVPALNRSPICIFVTPGEGRVAGICSGADSEPPPQVNVDGGIVNGG